MKKSQIWVIIFLMSVALIGLVSFQLYWINNALKINTQRFKSDVHESLSRVVNRLEQDHVAGHLKQIIEFKSDSSSFFVRQNFNSNDSVKTRVRITGNFDLADSNDSLLWVDNTTIMKHRAGMVKEGIVLMTDDPTFNADSARFKNRTEMVELVVTQMGNQIFEFEVPGKERIDSLLHRELGDKGIDIGYNFAVISQQPDTVLFASDPQSDNFFEYEFQATLNPNDLLGNLHYLTVNFPSQNQFLFKQIWVTLTSSIILLLIIIFCFSYAVITIIRQKKLSEIKNDFINNMTHEFKTPVATISLAAEALKEPEVLGNKSTIERYVSIIDEENTRLGSQVEKVLQSARLDRGDYNFNFDEVNITEMLEHIREQFEMKAEAREGSVSLSAPEGEVVVKADAHHLHNAVNNLVDNAIKYSEGKPEIDIRLERGAEVYIHVNDKGIGLSKESLKRVFDKFYRVPTGDLHDVKGFGLGLSYVNTIIQRHGGKVAAISSPGKGSTFTITLPVHE